MGFRYPAMVAKGCGYGAEVAVYGNCCGNGVRLPFMGASLGSQLWAVAHEVKN